MNLPEQILIAIKDYPWQALALGIFTLMCISFATLRRIQVEKRIIHEVEGEWREEANWKEPESNTKG